MAFLHHLRANDARTAASGAAFAGWTQTLKNTPTSLSPQGPNLIPFETVLPCLFSILKALLIQSDP